MRYCAFCKPGTVILQPPTTGKGSPVTARGQTHDGVKGVTWLVVNIYRPCYPFVLLEHQYPLKPNTQLCRVPPDTGPLPVNHRNEKLGPLVPGGGVSRSFQDTRLRSLSLTVFLHMTLLLAFKTSRAFSIIELMLLVPSRGGLPFPASRAG